MNRAAVVYLVMIVVLVGGLWGVLGVGGRLVAPDDLNGRWRAVEGGHGRPGVTVEQSGRYFELAVDGLPRFGATLVDRAADGRLRLARGRWRVTVDRPDATRARTFHVDGPATAVVTARRAAPTDPELR